MILGGKEYLVACPTMIVLNLCVIVLGMTWVMGVGVLQTLGRQNLYAKTMWMAVVINVSVNFSLDSEIRIVGSSNCNASLQKFSMRLCFIGIVETLSKIVFAGYLI